MLDIFHRHKKLIVFGIIFITLLGLALKVIVDVNYVEMTVSLNYTGVEKGLNPDNTRLDIFEISSDEVLDEALKRIAIPNMTVDDLKGRINIYPVLNKGVNERIKDATSSGKNFAYYPNVYTVIYSQKNKLAKNHTRELLKALAESYRDYFEKQYTDKSRVLTDIYFDIENAEYVDIPDIIESKLSSIIDYLNSKQQENASFRSATTNQTFNNLISGFTTIKNVDVANLNAYVNVNRIYKNKTALLEKLKYSLKDLEFKYQDYVNETAIIKEAMEKYELSITESMYVSSVDRQNNLYMNKTKTGFDYLTEKAVKRGVEMESIKKDIQSKQQKIAAYQDAQLTLEQQEWYFNSVNAMIESIKNKTIELARIASETIHEYTEQKTKGYLTYEVPPFSIRSFIGFGYLSSAVFYLIIGFVLSFLLAFLIDVKEILMQNRKISSQEEAE